MHGQDAQTPTHHWKTWPGNDAQTPTHHWKTWPGNCTVLYVLEEYALHRGILDIPFWSAVDWHSHYGTVGECRKASYGYHYHYYYSLGL